MEHNDMKQLRRFLKGKKLHLAHKTDIVRDRTQYWFIKSLIYYKLRFYDRQRRKLIYSLEIYLTLYLHK
jgi:hypothetical protein